jgi:hypothetical protein
MLSPRSSRSQDTSTVARTHARSPPFVGGDAYAVRAIDLPFDTTLHLALIRTVRVFSICSGCTAVRIGGVEHQRLPRFSRVNAAALLTEISGIDHA